MSKKRKWWPVPENAVHLTPDALDWALEHATQFGDTVFLPRPFEFKAIRYDWDSIRSWLVAQDVRSWPSRDYRRFLMPKRPFGFRYVTQLDPLDFLVFMALIHEVGPDLESYRVPATQGTAFSWRFGPSPDGRLFETTYTWTRFNLQCQALAHKPEHSWVLVADIADFFPRLYYHPLEQAVAEATSKSNNAYCLLRLIKNWNKRVSYGLPVGLSGSRILAETCISGIDRRLLALDYTFCRYADDYRFFCDSEAQAHRALEELASCLFDEHGLTIQPDKTDIVPSKEYLDKFDFSHQRKELESLTVKFRQLLEEAGVEDDYDIDLDDIDPSILAELHNLNLRGLMAELLESKRIDPLVASYVLRRLGQLNDASALSDVIDNCPRLAHVMHAVVDYIRALHIDAPTAITVGERILAHVGESSTLGEYASVCLLSVFTDTDHFNHTQELEKLFEQESSPAARREIILALGAAKNGRWFQQKRMTLPSLDAWSYRAFLAAFSCVNEDARWPFYSSLGTQSDILDRAVIRWATDNPIS